MTKRHTVLTLSLILAVTTASAFAKGDKPPEVTHDGLHLVPGTEVAAAWVKPGTDFSDYDKIMILEAGVAFRKNWLIDKNRTSVYHITKNDVEKMKEGMATDSPTAVVISATQMPLAKTVGSPSPNSSTSWKTLIMPKTVPSRPSRGEMAAMVPTTST